MSNSDPHGGQPIVSAGEQLATAHAAMVMAHGRGATAEDILTLVPEFGANAGWAFLAPQAAEYTWYPYRFLEPTARNEPWLSSALNRLAYVVGQVRAAGIAAEHIVLLGFSQGACLSLEYAARHAQRYGGIVGLSGGLIGPEETPRNYAGSFDHTPVFLGCSDVDFHIPKERVVETAGVFRRMSADVTMRLYPNMDHTVNEDEIAAVKALMQNVIKSYER
jgi:predicted esterase